MATLISRGDDIRFTIFSYKIDDTPLQQLLVDHPSDHVLGYVTHNKETGERQFVYTESVGLTETEDHWSLAVLKEFPYVEQEGPWIVYNCSPEKTRLEFGNILSKYSQSLHIYNWDTWSVQGKEAKVAVITSWEIF